MCKYVHICIFINIYTHEYVYIYMFIHIHTYMCCSLDLQIRGSTHGHNTPEDMGPCERVPPPHIPLR